MTLFQMKPGNSKVYIGIPRERFLMTQFVDVRDNMLARLHTLSRDAGYFQADGHRMDRNREKIAIQFMTQTDAEWLMMIDSDMEIPIRAPERLTAWNKPVVAALYFHRGESHEPFLFMEAPKMKDEYDRELRSWSAKRKVVYDYLTQNNVPMRDGSLTIDNGYGEPLVECDAVATGCIVIHRSVFEALKKPWFEYEEGGLSEDLTFCYRLRHELEIPVYCDISTICGHYHLSAMGQAQFRMKYESRPVTLSGFSRLEAADLLSKFFKMSNEKALKLVNNTNAAQVGELWRKKFDGTTPSPTQVDRFYKTKTVGQAYIMELIHWNASPVFTQIRSPLLKYRELNAIEIGSGIGSVAMQLLLQDCNVLSVETNPLLRDFIDYRWNFFQEIVQEKPKSTLSIVDETWMKKSPDESFDLAVAIDVFEHIPEENLKRILNNLYRVLKPKGILYYHNNFGQQDLYPMHFDYSNQWMNWLKEIGFTAISNLEAIKL